MYIYTKTKIHTARFINDVLHKLNDVIRLDVKGHHFSETCVYVGVV